MIELDIPKWAKQAGMTEVELVKAIVGLLEVKAGLLGIPQRIQFHCPMTKEQFEEIRKVDKQS